jgi:hypothetical protein
VFVRACVQTRACIFVYSLAVRTVSDAFTGVRGEHNVG